MNPVFLTKLSLIKSEVLEAYRNWLLSINTIADLWVVPAGKLIISKMITRHDFLHLFQA